MEKYRHIEHTSDVAFEAYGTTLEELFANAALATYSFMTDIEEIDEDIEKEVEVKSEDLYSLMFDWLDEILFLFESEGLILKKFDIRVDATNFVIRGKCRGGRYDPYKHEAGIIIKAVTYNMMEIKKNEIWRARVVLDV
ncbi:MAG: archease [Candidatus Methanospirareceae archaeon]